MSKLCYICNTRVHAWRQNLSKLKLSHSECTISDLLKQFLGDTQSSRDIDSVSNCICVDCFDRLNKYDWLRTTAFRKEKELRDLYLKTEEIHMKNVEEEDMFGENVEVEEGEKDEEDREGEKDENDDEDAESYESVLYEIYEEEECEDDESMDEKNIDNFTEEKPDNEVLNDQMLIKIEPEQQIESDDETEVKEEAVLDSEEEQSDGNFDDANQSRVEFVNGEKVTECEICRDGRKYTCREKRVRGFFLH